MKRLTRQLGAISLEMHSSPSLMPTDTRVSPRSLSNIIVDMSSPLMSPKWFDYTLVVHPPTLKKSVEEALLCCSSSSMHARCSLGVSLASARGPDEAKPVWCDDTISPWARTPSEPWPCLDSGPAAQTAPKSICTTEIPDPGLSQQNA